MADPRLLPRLRCLPALLLLLAALPALAGGESPSVLETDMTCDGRPDRVTASLEPGPPGPRLEIVVLPAGAAPEAVERASLPFADRQIALCGEPALLPLAAEDSPRPDDFFGQPVCRHAVRVEDPWCDAPRLYWAPEAAPGERLLIFRN